MRNISFSLTTEQIRNRAKTVTRRKGMWWASVLDPGTKLCAVEKARGIKKGELRRLCVIRVLDVSTEMLYRLCMFPDWGEKESRREGFPGLDGRGFADMFCRHMRCDTDQTVTRILFEYIQQGPACDGCSLGAMDRDNSHRNGLCRCECHGEEAFR